MTLASASGPPSRAASTTQLPRCSSSRPRATDCSAFVAALTEVCRDLAGQIVADGEGATKFITIRVEGPRNTVTYAQAILQ